MHFVKNVLEMMQPKLLRKQTFKKLNVQLCLMRNKDVIHLFQRKI